MARLSKHINEAPLGQGVLGGDNVDIPLGAKPYAQPYTSMGVEECKNFYVEYSPSETSVAPYYYVSRPGLKRVIQASDVSSAACRGLYTSGTGLTYGVFGNKVYQINADNSRTYLGAILTYSGTVRFADNGVQCIMVDGHDGHIIEMTAGTLTRITDEFFPGVSDPTHAPTHVIVLDTYFIVNEQNSNRYYWSTAKYLPYAFDEDTPDVKNVWWGLNYGEKIADSDNIVGLTKIGSWIMLLGARSIEVHYNTGNTAGQQFARYSPAPINFGCYTGSSIARFSNFIFFLGADEYGTTGIFQLGVDFQPKRVSTRGIEVMINRMGGYADAISFIHSQAGHVFLSLYFPVGDKTLVYDMTTDAWHERMYLDYQSGIEHAWQALYSTQTSSSTLLVGHRFTDAVYELDPSYYKDDNPYTSDYDRIIRVRTSPVMFGQARQSRYKMAQILCKTGVGLAVPDALGNGQDPQIVLSYANDGGAVFIPQAGIQIPMGKMGEYNRRCITYALGTGRNRTWKIICTEPVEVVLYGLVVSYEELRW